MTDSNESRLDRIEAILETTVRTVASQQGQIDALTQAVNRTSEFVLEISRTVRQQAESQQQIMNSIQAELDRQGRILDYLLGQQNNQNQ
jgi:hypothetical protein